MDSHWGVIFVPLALPVAAAAAGGVVSFFTFAKFRPTAARRGRVLLALIILSIVAAWIPNAAQQLYDFGLSFPAIEVLQAASYLVFAFALFSTWQILARSWQRWLLIILVPISFAQPLFWTWAYISWSIWGFAP
jgi:hypothetical protein